MRLASPTLSWLPDIREQAGQRIRRWARRRQGRDGLVATLRPGRVYILPTGVGIVFGIMAFAMLLGAMNYNNNLAFLLTFLLVGLGFVSMHCCQRNLVGLEIAFAGVEPVFAGDTACFRIALNNRSKNQRCQIWLTGGDKPGYAVDLPPRGSEVLVVPVVTERRGRVRLQRFAVRTRYPFELFRAWAWLHMEPDGLVYPTLATRPPLPPTSVAALGHRQHDARGEEDFAGLRKFQRGDSPRNVTWKTYARAGQLFSKRFSGADTSSQWFDFEALAGYDLEARLSILARWVVDADRRGEDYGLRLPGHEFAPAHGPAQRLNCLEALALFGDDASS